LRHLLKAAQLVPDDDRAITYAIDTIASSKDDKLANQLIDFLLGGDGLPKVFKYIATQMLYSYSITFDFFLQKNT
jgi:ABC-type molybdate transport system substrate-binding protein